jgi:hypothetical protein
MGKRLSIKFPSQGWKQFLASRRELLDAYDHARERARLHAVEVHHGRVAEAKLRSWYYGDTPVIPFFCLTALLSSSLGWRHGAIELEADRVEKASSPRGRPINSFRHNALSSGSSGSALSSSAKLATRSRKGRTLTRASSMPAMWCARWGAAIP